MMIERNKLILCVMMMAIVFAFAAPSLGAAGPPFPTLENECMVIYGDKANEWFTVGLAYDANGRWPSTKTCTIDGKTTQVAFFEYAITAYGKPIGFSSFFQTVPGQLFGGEVYEVYGGGDCTFSSVKYIPPAEGADPKELSCFATNLGERAVIHYVSKPSGDPPKFGHSSNQWSGQGWSSLGFKLGNEEYYCKQYDELGNVIGWGLPGPAPGDAPRLIRNVYKVLKFQKLDGGFFEVELEINETDCTFTATIDGVPQTQFPVTELKITGPDGQPMPVLEGWGSGKCDEATYEGTGSTCVFYTLGGRACKFCY
jgi:hypothetical protein